MTNPTLAHGAMPELPEVVAFLQGEAPLDGVWFGEKHPTERGNFWWRKHLRAAVGSQQQKLDDMTADYLRRHREVCELKYGPSAIQQAAVAVPDYEVILNPRRWTREMHGAWHGAIPDVQKAFEALRAAAPQPDTGDSVHLGGGECGRVQLQLGPVAFEFSSFQRWVDKARNWFINLAATNRNAAQKRYLSIDAAGRVCMIGADFMRARDENTFPVRVYLIDAEPAPRPDAPTGQIKSIDSSGGAPDGSGT